MLQRLRLAEARKWFPLKLTHKADNPESLRAVLFNPPSQILEGDGSNSRLITFQAWPGPPPERGHHGAAPLPQGAASSSPI